MPRRYTPSRTITPNSAAHREGRVAYLAGKTFNQFPEAYKPGSPAFWNWQNGWQQEAALHKAHQIRDNALNNASQATSDKTSDHKSTLAVNITSPEQAMNKVADECRANARGDAPGDARHGKQYTLF